MYSEDLYLHHILSLYFATLGKITSSTNIHIDTCRTKFKQNTWMTEKA